MVLHRLNKLDSILAMGFSRLKNKINIFTVLAMVFYQLNFFQFFFQYYCWSWSFSDSTIHIDYPAFQFWTGWSWSSTDSTSFSQIPEPIRTVGHGLAPTQRFLFSLVMGWYRLKRLLVMVWHRLNMDDFFLNHNNTYFFTSYFLTFH